MRKLYVLLLAGVLVLIGAPAAHAADNGSWSVYPATTQAGQRPYFYLSADPGATLDDRVTVTNKTDRPQTFRLYAADAYNTARDGGFAVRAQNEKQRSVGAWARTGRDRVTVRPHGSVTVPVTITVPEDAEPGDHPGALVALDERIDPADAGAVAVGIRKAVGARIYLRVNGPTVPALSVDDVEVEHTQPLVPGTGKSRAVISYTLRNRGNVTLSPKVALKAEGLFGRTLLARDLQKIPSELLPRQQVRLTEQWADAPQLEWGEIELTASARDTRESAAVGYFALPWLVAGVLLVIAGGAAALWIRARRSRARTVRDARDRPRRGGWYGRAARIGDNGRHERST
ncbi:MULTISPECIES: WxL protein peptidoglycan domain-containing protein [unclassified Streptomyces]|uniref:WxL protein peptidoglycan domain-containing protein n=1 Tax=unclassified Streptomyces TaxID=2593676 RepID=UPI0033F8CD24